MYLEKYWPGSSSANCASMGSYPLLTCGQRYLPERRSGSEIFAGTAFQRVPAPLHPWRVPADGVGEPATEQGADDAARYEESGGERPEHRERFRRHVASIALSISLVEEVHDQLQSVHRQTDTHTT